MKNGTVSGKPFTLQGGKTALIVVDLQNEFVRDGGLIQVKDAKATLETNKKLVGFFHQKGMPVIYTKMSLHDDWALPMRMIKFTEPDRIQGKALLPGHKRVFTDVGKELDVTDIVEEVYPEKRDPIIHKHWFDAFNATHLAPLLQGLSVEYVVVTGTVTHICVESTAKGAFNHGYFPVIVSDGVSSFAPEHFVKELLNQFENLWGRVMTSAEVIEELSH
ncbi:MAG TPA: isochorismatase family cysteine hydrolase [Thermodesulfobacteriota bacterium]|nr:isochorismatase family cysteine hydrolase [Thermodesulfobacteriota bacterium]